MLSRYDDAVKTATDFTKLLITTSACALLTGVTYSILQKKSYDPESGEYLQSTRIENWGDFGYTASHYLVSAAFVLTLAMSTAPLAKGCINTAKKAGSCIGSFFGRSQPTDQREPLLADQVELLVQDPIQPTTTEPSIQRPR